MDNLIVELYISSDCSICASSAPACAICMDVRQAINRVNEEMPFEFKEVDVRANTVPGRQFKEDIPTVYINGKKAFKYKIDENEFKKKIRKELIKIKLTRICDNKQSSSSV